MRGDTPRDYQSGGDLTAGRPLSRKIACAQVRRAGVEHRPATDDGAQRRRRRRSGAEVGQARGARARVGAPGLDPVVGRLDDEVADLPDREGGRQPEVEVAAGRRTGGAPAAAGVGEEGRARGDALVGVVVVHGGPDAPPTGANGVTGESEPEREGHAGAEHGGERVHRRGALASQPRGVHALSPAPVGVERGLHARP